MAHNDPNRRTSDPTMATAGLQVRATDNGTWLEFQTTDGRRDLVRMETIAGDLMRQDGPHRGYGEALRRWCRDQQHARTGRMPAHGAAADANTPADPQHERTSEAATEEDETVDAMGEDSFPASDPPSFSPSRTGSPERPDEKKRRKEKAGE
jgi:DNA replication initiation complex subunit (GINS family)